MRVYAIFATCGLSCQYDKLCVMNAKPHSMLAAAMIAVAVAFASGCASVHCSSPGAIDGINLKGAPEGALQIVYICNAGYYFLWTIPLASGDLRWNEEKESINGGFRLFRDMVSADDLQNALLKMAEAKGCDVVDVTFYDHDTSYAGVSYGGLIGSLFGSSEIGISGVFINRKERK